MQTFGTIIILSMILGIVFMFIEKSFVKLINKIRNWKASSWIGKTEKIMVTTMPSLAINSTYLSNYIKLNIKMDTTSGKYACEYDQWAKWSYPIV